MEYLRQFVRQLPELFPASGEVLHDGRNQIRAFDIGGERLVVKRYKRPSAFNAVMYSFFRKSKARRAYEHALRLRELEIDTPEPVAWSEYRRNGLITETYFVSPQVGLHTAHGGYGTVPDLRFAARARSILPFHRPAPRKRDLPRGFQPDQHPLAARRGDGTLRFPADRHKPHEIPPAAAPPRRMHDQPAAAELPGRGVSIHPRPLRRNEAVGYGRHAAAGTFFRLLFGRRQQFKKRFKARKLAAAGKKQG